MCFEQLFFEQAFFDFCFNHFCASICFERNSKQLFRLFLRETSFETCVRNENCSKQLFRTIFVSKNFRKHVSSKQNVSETFFSKKYFRKNMCSKASRSYTTKGVESFENIVVRNLFSIVLRELFLSNICFSNFF